MIISDLNHIENIEDTKIEGGLTIADAQALAASVSIGALAKSFTFTSTEGVAGLFAKSISASSAFAANP